jgi:hypothetical protein
MADLSTKLQHGATFFSTIGAVSEVGFTSAGLLFGSGVVSWADGPLPIADVTGGLAGGLVAGEVGHLEGVRFPV